MGLAYLDEVALIFRVPWCYDAVYFTANADLLVIVVRLKVLC